MISARSVFQLSTLLLLAASASLPAQGSSPLVVSWDAHGQPSALVGRDFAGPFTLAGTEDAPLVDLRFSDGARTFTTSRARITGDVTRGTEASNDIRTLTVTPVADDGTPAPFTIAQTFTLYPEGALFCDFTITLPVDAEPVTLNRAELTATFPSALFGQFRWFWKRDWRGGLYLPREQGLDVPGYLRVMGASFSRGDIGYTNHWEMFLEKALPLSGTAADNMRARVATETGGAKQFSWTLYQGEPVTLQPGFSYNNRWGMDLTAARSRSNAIGQRIAHWQEGNAALMTFPSDSAIEAMADCGVTLCILHLYWKAPGWGSNFTAFDDAEMRRWVETSHRLGIKCILYAIPIDKPGIDGINAESYGRYNCDGLYFDFGSVHFRGASPRDAMAFYPGRDFPAMDFLNLTRHYREVVGPDAVMIAHAGGAAPDALYCLNLDAYLPGEADEQAGLLSKDLDQALYHSGLAYAVCHPWCEYAPFQTRRAVANFCALGAFPQVLFGRGTHQDNNYHRSLYEPARFALPYWQMLRCLPMDRDTELFSPLTGPAVTADQPSLHPIAYRRGADWMLITVANLGEPCSGTLTLNTAVLKPAAGLRLYKLSGPDIADLRIDDLGPWDQGRIPTGQMATGDYTAFVLAGPDVMPELNARFDSIRALVSRFNDQTPPSAVSDLQAVASVGVVNLNWQPARDDAHVVAYRITRALDGNTIPVADAEETLVFADYAAPPAADLTYHVAAMDVAGNVGPLSAVQVSTPGADLLAEPLMSDTILRPVTGRWSFADGWYQQSAPQGPATEEGATYDLKGIAARFVRVYFTGGVGNYGSGHVIELQAKAPDGAFITPRSTVSSGDDIGHPAKDIMDGITDKTRNGWWSDRNRGLPAWVGLDFGEPVTIGSLWLLTYWDGQRHYQYSVEVSEDGQEWRPVAAVEGATPLARALSPIAFTNGSVSVTTLEIAPERAGGGLLFRCPDSDNGYAFYLDNGWDGNVVLARMEKGKLRPLKALFFPYSIFRPVPHLLRVEARGDMITCYADQVKVFEVQDATFASGSIGLFTLTGGPLRFRNLLVGTK